MLLRSCPRSAIGLLLIASCFTPFLPSRAGANIEPQSSSANESHSIRNFDLREVALHNKRLGTTSSARYYTLGSRKNVRVQWNDILELPHSIISTGAPLSDASDDDPAIIAKRFVRDNHHIYGLHSSEIDNSRVASLETDESGEFTRVVLQQRIKGLDVFDAEMMMISDAEGRIHSTAGSFVPHVERHSVRLSVSISSEFAESEAMQACVVRNEPDYQVKVETQQVQKQTDLVYYAVARNDIRLAYRVSIAGFPYLIDSWLVLIDAVTGELLRRDYLTYSFGPSVGRVFPRESPVHSDRTLISFSGDQHASPEGWIAASRTEGNNVRAIFNPEIKGGEPVSANADGLFDFPLSTNSGPITGYSDASVTNLFYWVNFAHDRFYSLGFTEQSRNFQMVNLNRGGREGDPVRAEALRGATLKQTETNEPVRNNAFFSTRPDGSQPLLAMLLWETNTNGRIVQLDSSYDAGVIIHEYAHGVSTRLTGTDAATGLRSFQGSGMGEGWSDFFAISFLNENRQLDVPQSIGDYLVQRDRGIRVYPYSTDMGINPLTFGDIRLNTEFHFQGTVWCSMLWDIRQAMIERYGFEAGRDAAERLIVAGLKMTPVSPLFTDGRDAILLADRLTNNGANQELLWKAFARRGLGASASTSRAFPGQGFRIQAVEAFDVPPVATSGMLTVNDRPQMPAVQFEPLPLVVSDRDLDSETSVSVQVVNLSNGSTTNLILSRTAAGRFSGQLRVVPPGSASSGNVVASTGDTLSIRYQNERDDSGGQETIEVRVKVGRRVELLKEDFDQGISGWSFPSNNNGKPNHWHLTERRSSSAQSSLYFAKKRGSGDAKSYTEAMSLGEATAPVFDSTGLISPRLEFDYYFSGLGSTGGTADVVTVLGGTLSKGPDDASFSLTYDIKPTSSGSFERGVIDLRFADNRSAVMSFVFTASEAKVKRKDYEGFYLDRVRVTAVSVLP